MKVNSWINLVVLIGLVILPKAELKADIFNSAEFKIVSSDNTNEIVFTAQLPRAVIESTHIQWPEQCLQTSFERQSMGNKSLLIYTAECNRSAIQNTVIITPWQLDGARLLLAIDANNSQQISLKKSYGGMRVPLHVIRSEKQTNLEAAQNFLWQGMLHIWMGWDHITFVLCLCLLARGRHLIVLVSAFTVGHSITLGLAFFQVINIPIQPIEVLIALSIVLMARELLLNQQPQPLVSIKNGLILIIIYGLLHGLGFASALKELQIEPDSIWLSLLFFNLGVELGQVLFILVMLAIFSSLINSHWQLRVKNSCAYLVGGLGVFWTIERLAIL